jgi:hypothetical protein
MKPCDEYCVKILRYLDGDLQGLDRTFPRRALTKGPNLTARCVERPYRRLQNHGVVGLLRRTEVAAHGFGGSLHRMDRTPIRLGNRIVGGGAAMNRVVNQSAYRVLDSDRE